MVGQMGYIYGTVLQVVFDFRKTWDGTTEHSSNKLHGKSILKALFGNL